MHLFYLFNKATCVLRPGQLLTEGVQAEARVDTLVEDAAQLLIPLDDENVFYAVLSGGDGGGQPRGASADDGKLHLFHACTSLV